MTTTMRVGPANSLLQSGHAAYRPDIDGLRAIAVLAVVFYHALPGIITGGYVGVDIFFVISGYLISGIIMKGIADHSFSLLEFYRRRVHRIFPALIAVLSFCLIVGYFYFASDEYSQLGKHVWFSSVFSENIALWCEHGYFDNDAKLKPLLHLWTLAIEEQFYIIFPLVLIALTRMRWRLITAIFSLCVLSFVANVHYIDESPIAVFFCPGTRAWELFAGGVLAAHGMSIKKTDSRKSTLTSIINNLLSFLGLLFIIISVIDFSNALKYPGYWAVLPVFGAVLMIYSGPESWIGKYVLGNSMMVNIGLISYPLYLWHWPMLSIWSIVEPQDDSISARIVLVLVSVVLAIFTYRFLERNVRRSKSRAMTVSLCVSAVVIALLGVLISSGRIHSRYAGSNFDVIVRKATADWRFPRGFKVVQMGDHCYYTAGGDGSKTLYWGDSHMEQYAPRILDLVKANRQGDRGVIFLTTGGVPPIPNVQCLSELPLCRGRTDDFMHLIKDKMIDTIVIAARWNMYFKPSSGYVYMSDSVSHPLDGDSGSSLALAALAHLLSQLASTGKNIYLIHDIPSGPEFDPNRIFHRGFLDGGFSIHAQGLDVLDASRREGKIRTFLDAIAEKYRIHVIDPLPFLVRGNIYPVVSGSQEPIYKDNNHLRASFVRKNVRFLDVTVRPAQ